MRMHGQSAAACGLALALASGTVGAHCDTLDGPVVSAARKALDSGDVNLVLIWVQKHDEAAIRQAFQTTRAVRKLGAEAKNLADSYFFETLVRVHRAGEGAPYTGLKSEAAEPPVAAADKAIATGKLEGLGTLVSERMEHGLHARFQEVMAKKSYPASDVERGRAFSHAYVEFVHYAERLYDAAETLAPDHGGTHTH